MTGVRIGKRGTIHGLARTQIKSPSVAEADSDARPRADGERPGAEPARTARDDQPGDDRQPGSRRAERRAHTNGQIQRRNLPESGNGKSSGETGSQSLWRI